MLSNVKIEKREMRLIRQDLITGKHKHNNKHAVESKQDENKQRVMRVSFSVTTPGYRAHKR